MRRLYTDYFTDLWDMNAIVLARDELYHAFRTRGQDWAVLLNGIFEKYLELLPAQAYDKMNENFVRSYFYLTFRDSLDLYYETGIEVNHAAGRSDFEAVGRADGPDPKTAVVVEFKHYTQAAMRKAFRRTLTPEAVTRLRRPPKDAARQVEGYAADLAAAHPNHTVLKYVVCSFSTRGHRVFQVR